MRELLTSRTILLAFAVMVGAGASELAMSQWASMLAERGLGLSKAWGDMMGPCLFAVLMGTARVLAPLLYSCLLYTSYYKDGELVVNTDIVTGKLAGHRTPTGLYSSSVSYTHLDVYKRQELPGETEYKLAQTIAGFLSKQMEG